MKVKLVSVLISFVFIFNLVGLCPAFASSFLIGDFENNETLWTDVAIYDSEAFSGSSCGLVTGTIDGSSPSAIFSCSYDDTVAITEGQTYSVEFYIKSIGTSSLTVPESHVYLSASDNIVVNVSKISSQWERVSAMFYAGRSGDFSLSLIFYAYTGNSQILIDDVNITRQNVNLSSMKIEGTEKAFIPVSGVEEYTYHSYAVDTDGSKISLLIGKIEPAAQLPQGVSFDTDRGILSVESTALPGTNITLKSIPPYGFEDVPVTPFTVTLDKNLISNSGFDDIASIPWDVHDDFNLKSDNTGNHFLELITVSDGSGSSASCSLYDTLYLQSNVLYVFRARVRDNGSYKTRSINTDAYIDYDTYSINVNISNIGSDKFSEICVATYVETDGMYRLNLSLSSLNDSSIFIDNTLFQEEMSAPSKIAFSAPAHISVPEKDSLDIKIYCAVQDQLGSILSGEPIHLAVNPSSNDVYLNGNTLHISSDASDNVYKITATALQHPDLSATHTIFINHENVGDGSFETHPAGQWWATSYPSVLSVVTETDTFFPTDGIRQAKLSMNGSISAILSDSLKKYPMGSSFVFTADINKAYTDIPTFATAMIYNPGESEFENNLFAAQFEVNNETPIQYVFTTNYDITGRLMIAFNTTEEYTAQELYLDNIKIEPARVSASNVNVSGVPYTDKTISGNYRFFANFNTSNISSYRWLISPTENGVYTALENQTEQSLSVTSDMENMYVKFEVTPISLDGPVAGAPITSPPVLIKKGVYSSSYEEILPEPEIPDTEPFVPNEPLPGQNSDIKRGDITVKNIYTSAISPKNVFADTLNHWAKNDIDILYSAGIINGKENTLFMPDQIVTRAEFVTFLIRAFDLAPSLYTNMFSDVGGYKWYSGAVETAVKYELAYGMGNGLFLPESPITREQMFSMIMRAAKKAGVPLTDSPKDLNTLFRDASEVSEWARYDLSAAYTLGFATGFENNIFPSDHATRAEAAVVIKRMIDYIDKFFQ